MSEYLKTLKEVQAGLITLSKLVEKRLSTLGRAKCSICGEWTRKDELVYDFDIWEGGICEDCHQEHYLSDPLYNSDN